MARASHTLVAAGSAAAALCAGWFLIAHRNVTPDAGLVDDREEFREFLERRPHQPAPDERGLIVGPIPEEDAYRVFSGIKSEAIYDPEVYYIREPNLFTPRDFPEHPGGKWAMRTNSQGFREDHELPEQPDARVVVLGDSHTDGVCSNRFSFANVLEDLLAERHPGKVIDVVNAGVGSHSFYNYLGGVTKYGRELAPDVIVCTVYGGNDFLGVLRPLHYFLGEPLPIGGEEEFGRIDRFRKAAKERADRNLGQAVLQLNYLTSFPELADEAVDTAILLTREMSARAQALNVDLVFVYLPPLWDVQIARYEPNPELLLRALRLDSGDVPQGADGWADRWIAETSDLGLTFLDLRPSFRAADVDLYWHRDYHINIEGHRRVAEQLLPIVDPQLEL